MAQIGTVRKKDGQNMAVLRVKTTGVVQIRLYDKDDQKGNVNTPSVRGIGSHGAPFSQLVSVLLR